MRQRLRLIPRAIVTGNDNGGCTRHEDPGPSHLLREERATSPPVPHAVWLSPPQRFAPVVPRVAHGTPMQDRGSAPTPHAERREYTACSFIYPCPAPAGPRKTAPAPRQRLTQAGCRVSPSAAGLPWCRSRLRRNRLSPPSSTGLVHHSLLTNIALPSAVSQARLATLVRRRCIPTGSFRHIPQAGKRHAEGVTHRCGLQPHSSGKASQDRSASP